MRMPLYCYWLVPRSGNGVTLNQDKLPHRSKTVRCGVVFPSCAKSITELLCARRVEMGWKGFVEGGVASVAAGTVTHPLDLIKVRMQLHGEEALQPALCCGRRMGTVAVPRVGPLSVGVRVVQIEGMMALFSGVSATILRQASYSTTSMGLYEILKKKLQEDGRRLPLHKKVMAGLIGGGVGAAVGNPADVAMVRMQADGRLPEAVRRNYNGVVDALRRMMREEGLGSLWRGSGLTIKRAMLVTASQLATYDHAKEYLMHHFLMGDGFNLHLVAGFSAGVMGSLASNPVDLIKTRIMNMKVETGKTSLYRGPLDCAYKTVKAEGLLALYKGFVPTICRQGPFTIILFITLEQMRKLLRDY